jgi:hypothetical protein
MFAAPKYRKPNLKMAYIEEDLSGPIKIILVLADQLAQQQQRRPRLLPFSASSFLEITSWLTSVKMARRPP